MRVATTIASPVAVLALAGCVTVSQDRAPQLELEGRVAVRAVEVQRGTQAVLEAADTAHQAGLLEEAVLRQVAEIGLRIGTEGERLSVVLAAVDASRDPVSQAVGVGRAQAIVETIQGLSGTFPEVPPAVQTAIVALNTTLAILATELEV